MQKAYISHLLKDLAELKETIEWLDDNEGNAQTQDEKAETYEKIERIRQFINDKE